MYYTFSPVSWATSKKTRWATTYTKKWPLFCPLHQFQRWAKKGGPYTLYKMPCFGSVFFSQWKKSAHEKLFWAFFRFFHMQKPFSSPLLGQMFIFFTPTFVFHGYFLVILWIFSRGTNEFSRAEIVFLHGEFYRFTGHILHFFSRASFWFSRARFKENFQG